MKPNQCPSTTVDRATDEPTRCILPAGHDGRHDDGCLTWTWGDVRPIFGTVTAAGPVRFIQGALPTDHEADARAGRALEAHYAAQPKRKIAAESTTLVLTPAHLRAMAAAGWRSGEENPATWLVSRAERAQDLEDDFRRVTAGKCAGDEAHCSCVPHLRRRIAELGGEE